MVKSVFITNFFEQKRTLESLIEESKAGSPFYLMISVSAFVTTLGLIINSPIIIIGGMLVAPLLFPILALGMGITTSSSDVLVRTAKTMLKSVALVFFISYIAAFIFNAREITYQMQLASDPNLLFFLVAFASGIIGAYAWAKETITSTLPGVAVTVSLIPPLSLTGVSLALFSKALFTGSLTLFLVNLLGIVAASAIVFSLFGFSGLQRVAEKKIEEEKIDQKENQIFRKNT